jgi:hypothetical protein
MALLPLMMIHQAAGRFDNCKVFVGLIQLIYFKIRMANFWKNATKRHIFIFNGVDLVR